MICATSAPISHSRPHYARALLALVLVAALNACSSSPSVESKPIPRDESVDFSGSWEMDYGRSDNVEQQLRSIYNELRRNAERRARAAGGTNASSMNAGADPSRTMARVIDLARMADYITGSQVVTVEQGPTDIVIEREDNFALTCTFTDDTPEPVIDELGSELCGWDSHQLVFLTQLPDGLKINHRLTVSPDRQSLQITTTLNQSGSPASFTVNRVYYRFNPLPADYECEYTLSRGNVCSRARL
jgi:hypothetical protein